jgi:hypothetical protein
MPNINEFIGPKPTEEQNKNLEIIVGKKPCSKCESDVDQAFWDPNNFIMSWTCNNGHKNTLRIN